MPGNHTVRYVRQVDGDCLELNVAWTGAQYTATLLRYDTSEPLPGVIAPSRKARTVLVAEKPAQRFRSTVLTAFALDQQQAWQDGQLNPYIQDLLEPETQP